MARDQLSQVKVGSFKHTYLVPRKINNDDGPNRYSYNLPKPPILNIDNAIVLRDQHLIEEKVLHADAKDEDRRCRHVACAFRPSSHLFGTT